LDDAIAHECGSPSLLVIIAVVRRLVLRVASTTDVTTQRSAKSVVQMYVNG
jgi:hypothetical protein